MVQNNEPHKIKIKKKTITTKQIKALKFFHKLLGGFWVKMN